MAGLIIDTPFREEEAFTLLREAGVPVTDGDCANTCSIKDEFSKVVEVVLTENKIEFQWDYKHQPKGRPRE